MFIARYEIYPHFCNKNTLLNYLSTRFWIVVSIYSKYLEAPSTQPVALARSLCERKTAAGHMQVVRREKHGRFVTKWWIHPQNGVAFILDMMIKYQNWSGNRQFWDNP
jgi:hypothetical protein